MSEVDDASSAPLSPPTIPQERQVAPPLVETLERLVTDATAPPSAPALVERLETLVELLIERGHLAPRHRRLLARLQGARPSPVRLSVLQDKRAAVSPDVDCASLLPLCKGRCCAMQVTLSEEDLAERRLAWDLQKPYELRRDPDHGYCAYLGDGGRCEVYDDRPATCRLYDCRRDPRVWIDFERRIPAPLPFHLVPEAWLRTDDDDQPAGDGDGGGAGPTISAG